MLKEGKMQSYLSLLENVLLVPCCMRRCLLSIS